MCDETWEPRLILWKCTAAAMSNVKYHTMNFVTIFFFFIKSWHLNWMHNNEPAVYKNICWPVKNMLCSLLAFVFCFVKLISRYFGCRKTLLCELWRAIGNRWAMLAYYVMVSCGRVDVVRSELVLWSARLDWPKWPWHLVHLPRG